MIDPAEFKRMEPSEILRRSPLRVSVSWTEAREYVRGRIQPGRSYARIRFKHGGAAMMDVDSGELRSGIRPCGKRLYQ